jgi:protein phosphatase
MELISAYYTDKGTTRPTNQDSLCIKAALNNEKSVILAAVCDGLGGLSDGETASAYVISKLSVWFEETLPELLDSELSAPELRKSLDTLLHSTNAALNRYSELTGKVLGTTMTSILISEAHEKIITAHIGDTRIYRITEEEASVLTTDHSVLSDEIREGRLTEEEAANDPRQNQLTKCMGGCLEDISFDYRISQPETECTYLICSDGFRKKLSANEIISALAPSSITDSSIAGSKLCELAELCMKRNESDNISGIILKLCKEGDTQ